MASEHAADINVDQHCKKIGNVKAPSLGVWSLTGPKAEKGEDVGHRVDKVWRRIVEDTKGQEGVVAFFRREALTDGLDIIRDGGNENEKCVSFYQIDDASGE
jgi:hypothetical protein